MFLTVIGTKTYSLLSDLLAPVKPVEKTYAELKAALKAHLKPKPVIIAERFQFHQRSQQTGEDVASYMAALRRLADKCSYGNHLEEALRDRFVCGLRGAANQRKLLAMDGLTLKTAYETAYAMEAADLRASQLQLQAQPAVPVVNVIDNKKPRPRPFSNTSCYRCGKTNHSQENCFYRQEKCRACGKIAHIARMCKSRQTQKGKGSRGQRTDFVEQAEGSSNSADAEHPTGGETYSLQARNHIGSYHRGQTRIHGAGHWGLTDYHI